MSLTKDIGGILLAFLAARPDFGDGGPGGRDFVGGNDLRRGRLDVALLPAHGLLDEVVEVLVQHGLAVRLNLLVELGLFVLVEKRDGTKSEMAMREEEKGAEDW